MRTTCASRRCCDATVIRSVPTAAVVIYALLLALSSLATPAGAQTDAAREARLRAEAEPAIVVGDAITLKTESARDFFAIFTEGKQKDVAFVVVHGVGVHPDFGLIGQLRVLLADAGYATLSIQMPVRPSTTSDPMEYVATFPDAAERITAAHRWLRERGYAKAVLASHSMGAWMSNVYFQNTPNSPYAAWVVIGITGRILSVGQNNLPILDVYGENDLAASVSKAWLRRMYLWFQPQSQHVMMPGADHHHAGKEKALSDVIVGFVAARLQPK